MPTNEFLDGFAEGVLRGADAQRRRDPPCCNRPTIPAAPANTATPSTDLADDPAAPPATSTPTGRQTVTPAIADFDVDDDDDIDDDNDDNDEDPSSNRTGR